MGTYKKNGCRERGISSIISYKLLSFHIFHKLLQSTISTLLLLPALFSCKTTETDNESTIIRMQTAGKILPTGTLDIFTFDLDGIGHLDSYQHHDSFSGSGIELRSQNGEKRLFICMNGQKSIYEWAGINTIKSMDDVYIELRNEKRKALCATGEAIISAGNGIEHTIELRYMASEIVLNSIRCDFKGRTYEGMPITDPVVYLTNVNSRCSLTSDGDIIPSEIINAGRADSEEIDLLAEPDMVYQKMPNDIGERRTVVGMSFICYPNTGTREGPGTPFTRLVIEGKIDGERFWWPIDINRNEDTDRPGIHRNTRYIFDINLTRKGSSDPETALDTDAAEVKMSIMPWKEKEEQDVTF